MKTLFKLTLLAFVLAIMTPIAFFAWRMGQPMDAPEFKGLTYYQYLDWTRQEYDKAWEDVDMEAYYVQHPNSGLDADACFQIDMVTHVGPFVTEGANIILTRVLLNEPVPALPLQTWWNRFEQVQVFLLAGGDGGSCRISTSIPDDYALSVRAQ